MGLFFAANTVVKGDMTVSGLYRQHLCKYAIMAMHECEKRGNGRILMKKAIAAICCALLACTGCVWGAQMMAQEENSFSTGAVLPPDHLFTTMDEEGRLVIMDTAQMEAQTAQHNASAARQRGANVKEMRAITHGVVNFRTKNSASLNTSYTGGRNRLQRIHQWILCGRRRVSRLSGHKGQIHAVRSRRSGECQRGRGARCGWQRYALCQLLPL